MRQTNPEAEALAAANSISLCPNGCAHLRFGSTTITLTAGSFRAFMAVGLNALRELDARVVRISTLAN